MKALILFFVLAATSSAFAHLGESFDECVQRYGKPMSNTDNYGRVEIATFTKSRFKITITFLDAKAVSVVYRLAAKTGWDSVDISEEEIKDLLEINSDGKEWKQTNNDPIEPMWKRDGARAGAEPNGRDASLTIWAEGDSETAQKIIDAAQASKSTQGL